MRSADPARWYDRIALLYDPFVLGVYARARRRTFQQLALERGDTVLDLACGTGANFRYIVAEIGSESQLIGADYSAGMLARARRKVERLGWRNVHLIHHDARTLSREVIERAVGLPSVRIDRVVCTLGYSVMPEWPTVFERTWKMLAPGGRYAIMDWFFEDSGPFTRFVDWTAASDVHRRFWEPLEGCARDFERETLFAGRLRIISGRKPGH